MRWSRERKKAHLLLSVSGASPVTLMRTIKLKRGLVVARDFFSTILDSMAALPTSTTTPTPATIGVPGSSSVPSGSLNKKRTRSALKSLNINDVSPERIRVTRLRKASKSSSASSKDHGNVVEGQENMMLDG